MAIVGLGTDIVEIARIEKSIAKNTDSLAKRILTSSEYELYQQKNNKASFLAKRFAAKEAAAKALGTGIAAGITLQDFSISNNEQGKPEMLLSGVADELAKKLGVTSILLSISDERHYAVATVLLQK